jgi:hypothetical protein
MKDEIPVHNGPIVGTLTVTFCSATGIRGELTLDADAARLLWETLGGATVGGPLTVAVVPLVR